jgi:hypothetical protein
MDAAAATTMIIAMVIIWGGLVVSIAHAVRSSRRGR